MRSGGACQFVSTNCREKREARGAAELMNVVEGGEKTETWKLTMRIII